MDELNRMTLALTELRGLVEVGFAKVDGQQLLILQRLDQVDDRHAELARKVEQDRVTAEARHAALEARVDVVEREAVTRTQMNERTKQIIAIVTALITLAGTVIALLSLTTRG